MKQEARAISSLKLASKTDDRDLCAPEDVAGRRAVGRRRVEDCLFPH